MKVILSLRDWYLKNEFGFFRVIVLIFNVTYFFIYGDLMLLLLLMIGVLLLTFFAEETIGTEYANRKASFTPMIGSRSKKANNCFLLILLFAALLWIHYANPDTNITIDIIATLKNKNFGELVLPLSIILFVDGGYSWNRKGRHRLKKLIFLEDRLIIYKGEKTEFLYPELKWEEHQKTESGLISLIPIISIFDDKNKIDIQLSQFESEDRRSLKDELAEIFK